MGALPAVLGLIALSVGFGVVRPAFFTAGNLANLLPQGAAPAAIAMGIIFVLLLGEIDLSAGYASGICAAIMAQTLAAVGLPWYVAILASLVTGLVIGLVLGHAGRRRSASRPSWSRWPRSWRSRAWCCSSSRAARSSPSGTP